MMQLLWTIKKPTEPGWYWLQLVDGYGDRAWSPRIVHVERDGRSGGLTEVNRAGFWQWAGPIPEPVETPTATTPNPNLIAGPCPTCGATGPYDPGPAGGPFR